MRFEITESARADIGRLTPREREMFKAAARDFNAAADAWVADNQPWPQRLRAKAVQGAKRPGGAKATGVFEMTWSFAGPDGRTTWEWTVVSVAGERHPAVRWRRVGGHEVFNNP